MGRNAQPASVFATALIGSVAVFAFFDTPKSFLIAFGTFFLGLGVLVEYGRSLVRNETKLSRRSVESGRTEKFEGRNAR
jgi:hypothetical protein